MRTHPLVNEPTHRDPKSQAAYSCPFVVPDCIVTAKHLQVSNGSLFSDSGRSSSIRTHLPPPCQNVVLGLNWHGYATGQVHDENTGGFASRANARCRAFPPGD